MSEPVAAAATPLGREIAALITDEGPMPVARYVALCLAHPRYGYYVTRDPLGADGDFVTAPEVSQMFGELLGLWAAAAWQAMGAPRPLYLVELGPGRGTLMADALRAARLVPDFIAASELHLVEISPRLREKQREALAGAALMPRWHEHLANVPEGPTIVIANEFLDALPVHQLVRTPKGWHERVVGLDAAGALAFGVAPTPLPDGAALVPAPLRDAAPGSIFEWRDPAPIAELARRVTLAGGTALLIDYGHTAGALGDTLQAVRAHRYADVLGTPGEADLTAHVDFAALAEAARRQGAAVHGPATQGDFLRRLGIAARAARLQASAGAAQRQAIDAALQRLVGGGPNGMGELFKVLALADPALPPPPGFAM